ncbi:phytanoyl-CoA dioxygenase family protein [Janibacter cremeus]|uniref:Ectoine hydroxylase-related dioxygenase (Phytanoyl-CoA dioxygenase family) n=1 Tax=Janibacter cremeus TaxID=1285192 RepID=A0A852VTQ4_9MICO|nr:phytanoyl-CoA dioxygenase family protein [Janibacter cremeus]NYF99328.1 ectoine hydroxylase-related dioxygenase (phytanoyl-CoA dioxygenase family) [Janibacter cremeus]
MTTAALRPSAVVDATTAEEFAATGAVIVRGLFSPEEVATIERGIERTLAEPSPRKKVASSATDPGSFVEDFCNWQRIEEFRRVAYTSRAADVAAALTGSERIRLYHDHVLVKEPGTQQETPWHQDQPYYNVDGLDNCSMWAPVDPVAAESTLEFLAGSHRQGWLMPRTFMSNEARWFPEGSLSELPDIEAHRCDHDIRGWAMQPGDAVFFHMLTLHHAYGVPGTTRRRAFSLRFLGDDMVHAPRRWVTSPQFDGLEDEIAAGAPMDHGLFPVLREGRAAQAGPID